jgi:hypothetical protein
MPMTAATSTATAMTINICVVLISEKFMTCLQFLLDSLAPIHEPLRLGFAK